MYTCKYNESRRAAPGCRPGSAGTSRLREHALAVAAKVPLVPEARLVLARRAAPRCRDALCLHLSGHFRAARRATCGRAALTRRAVALGVRLAARPRSKYLYVALVEAEISLPQPVARCPPSPPGRQLVAEPVVPVLRRVARVEARVEGLARALHRDLEPEEARDPELVVAVGEVVALERHVDFVVEVEELDAGQVGGFTFSGGSSRRSARGTRRTAASSARSPAPSSRRALRRQIRHSARPAARGRRPCARGRARSGPGRLRAVRRRRRREGRAAAAARTHHKRPRRSRRRGGGTRTAADIGGAGDDFSQGWAAVGEDARTSAVAPARRALRARRVAEDDEEY